MPFKVGDRVRCLYDAMGNIPVGMEGRVEFLDYDAPRKAPDGGPWYNVAFDDQPDTDYPMAADEIELAGA